MPTFVAGLDLGQVVDPTAIVVVEKVDLSSFSAADIRFVTETVIVREEWRSMGRVVEPAVMEQRKVRKLYNHETGELEDLPEPGQSRYDVRHIEQYPLGTSYPAIVDSVCAAMARPPLNNQAMLAVDATGVGRPVVDMLRKQARCPVVPVLITAGNATTHEDGYWHVPKRDLVGQVQVLLQNRQLTFPKQHPHVPVLTHELQNFQGKISQAGHDSYNAREGEHDDLLLALCIAVWQAQRGNGIRIRHL